MHTTFEETHSDDIVIRRFAPFKIEVLILMEDSIRFYVFSSAYWERLLNLSDRLSRVQFKGLLDNWLEKHFKQESFDLLDFAIWRDGACQSPYDNDRYQDVGAALREVTPVERVS